MTTPVTADPAPLAKAHTDAVAVLANDDSTGRARLLAGRLRTVAERTATDVVARVGRALGAAPLALDAAHGERVADLGLYLRQSHAERDLEEHGRALRQCPW